ncbi:hypothetical protein RFI_04444, partial [Reticulomyxa filosa]
MVLIDLDPRTGVSFFFVFVFTLLDSSFYNQVFRLYCALRWGFFFFVLLVHEVLFQQYILLNVTITLKYCFSQIISRSLLNRPVCKTTQHIVFLLSKIYKLQYLYHKCVSTDLCSKKNLFKQEKIPQLKLVKLAYSHTVQSTKLITLAKKKKLINEDAFKVFSEETGNCKFVRYDIANQVFDDVKNGHFAAISHNELLVHVKEDAANKFDCVLEKDYLDVLIEHPTDDVGGDNTGDDAGDNSIFVKN